jgi:hypothetical protein
MGNTDAAGRLLGLDCSLRVRQQMSGELNCFCWVAGAGTETKTAGRERSGLSAGVTGEAFSPQRKSQVKRVSVMYTKMQPKYKRYFTTNEVLCL